MYTFFKTSIRQLLRNKVYSAINIFGLAVGLAGFIIILLYLNHELSYDKWHPKLNQVYKVSLKQKGDILPQTPAPLSSFIVQNYSGAEAGTTLQAAGEIEIMLDANGKKIYQKGMVMVDSLFLKVFPYQLIKGNASSVLNIPNAVVLSEEVSKKLFGDEDPVGKPLRAYNDLDGVITGVFREPDGPSHMSAKIIMRDPYEAQNKFWTNYSYQTYIKLYQPVDEVKMEDAINRLYYDERVKTNNVTYNEYKKKGVHTALFTDAVASIHNFPKYGNSNIKTVAVLMLLSVLLLIAGAINFSNLSIAKSIGRAKEVGVRKVLGSGKRKLFVQFMAEAFIQCLLSLGVAAVIVMVMLPFFNSSFNLNLSFWNYGNKLSLIGQIAACLLVVTLLSGLYPSFFLTQFNTSKVLKGNYTTGKKGLLFRNVLIVIQFVVSSFFVMAAVVMNSQMSYMQNQDKGFSGKQVMRIEAMQNTRDKNFEIMRSSLLSIPEISYVAKTTSVPGDAGLLADTSTYSFKHKEKEYRMASEKVSKDYFNALEIDLVKGRLFTDSYTDQNTRSAIINETAAKNLNMTNPIGETIYYLNCDTAPIQIIGIVRDINRLGFQSKIQPVVYTIGNNACMFQSGGAVLVKINGKRMTGTVAAIEAQWKKIEPDMPIRYSFLDDNFQRLFDAQLRLQKVIHFFAIIAILVSLMGLFALTAYLAQRRNKEISVRKVLGASLSQLTGLLGKEFIYLVLLAILITAPLAWLLLNSWLNTFSYRISISWWMFASSGLFLILIAMLTISFQAIKAALANPIKSLRSE